MKIKDKEFALYLTENKLNERCKELGRVITADFKDKDPLFLSVLNGSFMFLSDLIRYVGFNMEINFIKLASYQKDQSSGDVKEIIGITGELAGRHVLVIEDIVDTGTTCRYLRMMLQDKKAASVSIAAMFLKPDMFLNQYPVKYVGFEIPNQFVVGYGLDYDGYGRNLKDLYQIKHR